MSNFSSTNGEHRLIRFITRSPGDAHTRPPDPEKKAREQQHKNYDRLKGQYQLRVRAVNSRFNKVETDLKKRINWIGSGYSKDGYERILKEFHGEFFPESEALHALKNPKRVEPLPRDWFDARKSESNDDYYMRLANGAYENNERTSWKHQDLNTRYTNELMARESKLRDLTAILNKFEQRIVKADAYVESMQTHYEKQTDAALENYKELSEQITAVKAFEAAHARVDEVEAKIAPLAEAKDDADTALNKARLGTLKTARNTAKTGFDDLDKKATDAQAAVDGLKDGADDAREVLRKITVLERKAESLDKKVKDLDLQIEEKKREKLVKEGEIKKINAELVVEINTISADANSASITIKNNAALTAPEIIDQLKKLGVAKADKEAAAAATAKAKTDPLQFDFDALDIKIGDLGSERKKASDEAEDIRDNQIPPLKKADQQAIIDEEVKKRKEATEKRALANEGKAKLDAAQLKYDEGAKKQGAARVALEAAQQELAEASAGLAEEEAEMERLGLLKQTLEQRAAIAATADRVVKLIDDEGSHMHRHFRGRESSNGRMQYLLHWKTEILREIAPKKDPEALHRSLNALGKEQRWLRSKIGSSSLDSAKVSARLSDLDATKVDLGKDCNKRYDKQYDAVGTNAERIRIIGRHQLFIKEHFPLTFATKLSELSTKKVEVLNKEQNNFKTARDLVVGKLGTPPKLEEINDVIHAIRDERIFLQRNGHNPARIIELRKLEVEYQKKITEHIKGEAGDLAGNIKATNRIMAEASKILTIKNPTDEAQARLKVLVSKELPSQLAAMERKTDAQFKAALKKSMGNVSIDDTVLDCKRLTKAAYMLLDEWKYNKERFLEDKTLKSVKTRGSQSFLRNRESRQRGLEKSLASVIQHTQKQTNDAYGKIVGTKRYAIALIPDAYGLAMQRIKLEYTMLDAHDELRSRYSPRIEELDKMKKELHRTISAVSSAQFQKVIDMNRPGVDNAEKNAAIATAKAFLLAEKVYVHEFVADVEREVKIELQLQKLQDIERGMVTI